MEKERFYQLRQEMELAFSNNEIEKAENLANEYLALAKTKKDDWNFGNAIHHANLILGRIALRNGDISKAKEYLLEAGKTKGSPQLNSFGPNMTLAKELLEKGEKEVVIEFINFSKKYWNWFFSFWRIRKWKKEIRKGLIPDFKANLIY